MSYEGYTQNLCENGHRFDVDVHARYGKEPLCPICGRRAAWSNSVDETNCEAAGFIPEEEWDHFLHTREETEVCNLGHTHIVKHATYLIPTEEQAAPLRTYIARWEGDTPVRVRG